MWFSFVCYQQNGSWMVWDLLEMIWRKHSNSQIHLSLEKNFFCYLRCRFNWIFKLHITFVSVTVQGFKITNKKSNQFNAKALTLKLRQSLRLMFFFILYYVLLFSLFHRLQQLSLTWMHVVILVSVCFAIHFVINTHLFTLI